MTAALIIIYLVGVAGILAMYLSACRNDMARWGVRELLEITGSALIWPISLLVILPFCIVLTAVAPFTTEDAENRRQFRKATPLL